MRWPARTSLTCSLAAVCSLAVLADARVAEACGGTFCDNLPDPMPVDQTGEDILFVLDGSTVEVHVRIEYDGEAERFAWVLPLQGIPEIAVGSDPLFTALSRTTAPVWETSTTYDCDEDDPWGGDPTGSGTLSFVPDQDFAGTSEPEIVLQDIVGAFEIVVLQGLPRRQQLRPGSGRRADLDRSTSTRASCSRPSSSRPAPRSTRSTR